MAYSDHSGLLAHLRIRVLSQLCPLGSLISTCLGYLRIMVLLCSFQLLFHVHCLLGVEVGLGHPLCHYLWASTKSLLDLPSLCLATQTLVCLGGEFKHSVPGSKLCEFIIIFFLWLWLWLKYCPWASVPFLVWGSPSTLTDFSHK